MQEGFIEVLPTYLSIYLRRPSWREVDLMKNVKKMDGQSSVIK